MFTKKAQRNRNQNKCLGELSLTSNFGFNFNKSVLDHILLYADLRHIILLLIIIIIFILIFFYYYYFDNDDDDDHNSESPRKDNEVRSKLRN